MTCPTFCTSRIVSVVQSTDKLTRRRRRRGVEMWEARSGFHISMPHLFVCCLDRRWYYRRWCWRPVTQRGMWAQRVVLDTPTLDDDLRLLQRVEDLAIQALVS